jgi:integrase/recombinase XerC
MKRDSPWVFPGRKNVRAHVAPATIWQWCKQVADMAGIREITTHQLRHLAITEIYDRTGDLKAAQEFAGHASSTTTQIYTRRNVVRLTAAVYSINYEEDDQ